MATGDVALSLAIRQNLLSNKATARQIEETSIRLGSGRKVNSAVDNVSSFFGARALNTRAGDLSRIQDAMGQAIQTLKATDQALSAATSVIEQMQAIAREAFEQAGASGGAPADQASLVASFNELRTQLDNLTNDAGYRGVNLLRGSDLTVTFNEGGTSTLTISGVDFTAAADLDITAATFTNAAGAQTTLDELSDALDLVRGQSRVFSTNLTVIQTRQAFTENLINTLREGSDKLTLADSDEEGANLVALQTRQQLGVAALSLAAQSQQSVLRLF